MALAPPKFTIIQPVGKVPAFDPNNATMVGWAEETSLDVQYSVWGRVVSGLSNKLRAAMAHVMPDGLLAQMHRRQAEPGRSP